MKAVDNKVYKVGDIYLLKCPKCGKKLDWVCDSMTGETVWSWNCCKQRYTLYIEKVKLVVEEDND